MNTVAYFLSFFQTTTTTTHPSVNLNKYINLNTQKNNKKHSQNIIITPFKSAETAEVKEKKVVQHKLSQAP